jgi:hypothetical protein
MIWHRPESPVGVSEVVNQDGVVYHWRTLDDRWSDRQGLVWYTWSQLLSLNPELRKVK